MFLAFSEIRRSIGRFVMLTSAIALLVFLVLFQTSIRNGLLTTFVGGIRNQSAPVLVLSTDGLRTLSRSAITDDQRRAVEAVDGVARTGGLGNVVVPAVAGGDTTAISVVGYEHADLGGPTRLSAGRLPRSEGEVVANDGDAPDGYDIGDRITVLPGRAVLTVVGRARDIDLSQPTVFGSLATFGAVVRAANPDAAATPVNALAVAPADGVSGTQLTARINATSTDLDALTREALAEETPGVSQVSTSFLLIFILFGVVVPLVTGLFFLIITFQKAGALTLLRAIGAWSASLVRALLIQVIVVIGFGVGLGVALYAPASNQKLGGITLRFDAGAVVLWAVLLMVLGLLSSLVAARRVLAIDPIEATTGAGVGR